MRKFLLVLALLVFAAAASAQTPVPNPTIVEFTPSTDHAAVDGITGQAIVTRYDLQIYLEGASEPFSVQSIGKPDPVAGKIVVTNAALFTGLAEGIRHVARVVAVGPTGSGVSDLSNPFGRPRTSPPAAGSGVVIR